MVELDSQSYEDLLAALRKDLQLDATTDILPGTILQALVDRNGASPFLQFPSTSQLRAQVGRQDFGTIPATLILTPRIILPVAWKTVHVAFVATVRSYTNSSASTNYGSDIDDLASGIVTYQNNSSSSQSFAANWISFGY